MFLAKNKEFTDKLAEGVEKLEKAMKTLENDFNSPETGLKKKSEDLVAATLLNIDKVSSQVSTDSTKQMLELEKKIKEVMGTVENVKDSAFRAGEVIGKYSNLKPLLSIYIGESADAGQVKVSMVAMLDALGKWLGKQGYRQSKMDCDQLKETLKNEWLAIAS